MYFLSGSKAIVEIQSIENQTHILRVGDDSWISSLLKKNKLVFWSTFLNRTGKFLTHC